MATAAPSHKRKHSETDEGQTALVKAAKPDTHYRQVVMQYRQLWHYLLSFAPDKSRVWCSWVSWDWHGHTRGVRLDDSYGDFTSLTSFCPSDYFSCRVFRVRSWKSLFFCHSSVTDLDLDLSFNDVTRSVLGFMPHLKTLKLSPFTHTIQYLPEHLESLTCECSLNPSIIPRSLRTLCMGKYDGSAPLPRWIEHLKLTISKPKDEDWLPSSLISLDITVDEWDVCTQDLLPDGLKKLSITCYSRKGEFNPIHFYPRSLQEVRLVSRDEIKQIRPPSRSVIQINRSKTLFTIPNWHIKALHDPFINAVTLDKGDLHERLEEIHDTNEHLSIERHKKRGGIGGLQELPKSVRVLFHKGKAYDPRTFEPIPEPATRVEGPVVIFESC
jgi:hypothetical protein